MTRTLTLLAAAAALAGCNNQAESADEAENAAAANVPIVLPPSIAASHPYRCKDNSLIFIDWMSDGTARVKTDRAEVGTPVPVGGENPTLTGDASAKTITYNGQSCNR